MENKNINTAEFWDEQFKQEYEAISKGLPTLDAQSYVRWSNERFGLISRFIPSGVSVLDYGCGLGHLVRYLRAKLVRGMFVGVDFSGYAIDMAQAMDEENIYGNINDSKIPVHYDGWGWDVIIASEVIEHLDDAMGFIDDAYEKLAHGGRLIITTPIRGVGGEPSHDHVHEFTIPELKAILEKKFVGIEIEVPPTKIFSNNEGIKSYWFLISANKGEKKLGYSHLFY